MSNLPEQTGIFEFNLLSPQFCRHSHLSYCISSAFQNSAEARGAKKNYYSVLPNPPQTPEITALVVFFQ